MLNKIFSFAASSLCGNIIAFLSMAIAVASLIVTIEIDKKAKNIQSAVDAAKANTTDKVSLRNYTPEAVEKLKNITKSIEEVQNVSSGSIDTLTRIMARISRSSDCFKRKDILDFNFANEYIIEFKDYKDDAGRRMLLSHIEKVIEILERGDFVE